MAERRRSTFHTFFRRPLHQWSSPAWPARRGLGKGSRFTKLIQTSAPPPAPALSSFLCSSPSLCLVKNRAFVAPPPPSRSRPNFTQKPSHSFFSSLCVCRREGGGRGRRKSVPSREREREQQTSPWPAEKRAPFPDLYSIACWPRPTCSKATRLCWRAVERPRSPSTLH